MGDLLGLDEGSALLEQARQRWSRWAETDDRLAVVEDFDDLRDWLSAADHDAADEVLLALAMLAAPDGGDDVAAAGALAKCLLPGACRVAAWLATQRRHMLPGDVSVATEMVASQLWIEVRTFPWRCGKKVAANILMNTRASVLRECGDLTQVGRTDQTWVHTDLVEAFVSCDPTPAIDLEGCRRANRNRPGAGWKPCLLGDPTPGPDGDDADSPLEELLALLAWACEKDVISDDDRFLLLCLVEEADRIDTRRTGRGGGGLMANDLSARVAPRIGVSDKTVRRRTAKTMRALAAAAPGRFPDDQ